MKKRPFRTDASLEFEKSARDRILPFLEQHGFRDLKDQRTQTGSATSQVVHSTDPTGVKRKMRVRLCWRRDGRNDREKLYSAAQLRARLIDNDWERTVASVAERGATHGVRHTLFVQADAHEILFAVIVPNVELVKIWTSQRKMSAELIQSGLMGRMRKNHAENGSSPTIWLQDERTPAAHKVSDLLWSWPGVLDVRSFPSTAKQGWQDALDDLPIQAAGIGSDEGRPQLRFASGWVRDHKVRDFVRLRSNGVCERSTCNEKRDFAGFLDVHHILGVRTSDRPWTCVALCPNCHRDAHYAPNSEEINAQLLKFAEQFRPSK